MRMDDNKSVNQSSCLRALIDVNELVTLAHDCVQVRGP